MRPERPEFESTFLIGTRREKELVRDVLYPSGLASYEGHRAFEELLMHNAVPER